MHSPRGEGGKTAAGYEVMVLTSLRSVASDVREDSSLRSE